VFGGLDDGVGVGGDLDVRDAADARGEAGVEGLEPQVQVRARDHRAAREADDAVVAAVQVDDGAAARRLVQQVHVLRDDADDGARRLHGGDRLVPGVGLGAAHVAPADVVAGPVVAAEALVAHELLVSQRVARGGAGAAVVRDAGVRADAGAGEDGDAATAQEAGGVVGRAERCRARRRDGAGEGAGDGAGGQDGRHGATVRRRRPGLGPCAGGRYPSGRPG